MLCFIQIYDADSGREMQNPYVLEQFALPIPHDPRALFFTGHPSLHGARAVEQAPLRKVPLHRIERAGMHRRLQVLSAVFARAGLREAVFRIALLGNPSNLLC